MKPLVHAPDAVLVDIRFTPEGDLMHWRRIYLKTLLGGKYRHVPHLGARSFRQGSSDAIQNLQLGVQTLLNLDSNLILMCACAEYENCHRRLIAAELERQGINVMKFSTGNARCRIPPPKTLKVSFPAEDSSWENTGCRRRAG